MRAVKQAKSYYCGPASLRALQLELGRPEVLSQDEWAKLARTSSRGTSINGMKRCLKIISPNGFRVIRKTEEPFGVGIVYCWDRDHWMVARATEVGVKLIDPEGGMTSMYHWPEFQKLYLNSARNSYVLAVNPEAPGNAGVLKAPSVIDGAFVFCGTMKLRIGYSDGRYQTYPLTEVEALGCIQWATIVELTPEQAARYEAHLTESAYWHNEFRRADNVAYDIHHNAGGAGDPSESAS